MKKRLPFLKQKEKEVLESFVKELGEELGDEILAIRLFGSKVRGDSREGSDIDIFILVKEKKGNLRDRKSDIAADYFFEYNIPLSPVVYSMFEYNKNKELGSFFFENVEEEGIFYE